MNLSNIAINHVILARVLYVVTQHLFGLILAAVLLRRR